MPIFTVLVSLMCVGVFVLETLHIDWPLHGYISPASPSLFEAGVWWTSITSIFLHKDIFHLVNNILSLLWIGTSYEKHEGHIRFLIVYFLSGMVGAWWYCHVQIPLGTDVPVVGASGSIFGLFAVYAIVLVHYLFVLDAMDLRRMMVSRSLSMLIKVLLWNVVYGFFSVGIANEAHLGGFVAGLVLGLLFLVWDRLLGRKLVEKFPPGTNQNNFG